MYLGLDIGTTGICCVVLDENGSPVFSQTEANRFGASNGACRTQDAEGIYALCFALYEKARAKYAVSSVGISGQMHGMLYVDAEGRALTPLYSWQDGRGDLICSEGESYAARLARQSGYRVATGYGAVSLFYDVQNGTVPENAASFCTVGDYIAMRLASRKSPLLHPTCAASMGLFDLAANEWDGAAIARASLPASLFPAVTAELVPIGKTEDGALVYPAVGDNQASVYGVLSDDDSFVVNVGTGSQLSLVSDALVTPSVGEVRPYFGGKYLLAGSALCGGYSFRLLRNFFHALGSSVSYDEMDAWACEALDEGREAPVFTPVFRGTREDPSRKASIEGITEENFDPKCLVLSLMSGVCRELKDFYDAFLPLAGARKRAVGTGNAVRMNRAFRRIVREQYALPLAIPAHKEEAAFGAALLAAEAFTGKSLKHFIAYEPTNGKEG